MSDRSSDSGALLAAMLFGVFGLAWTEWGASGLTGASRSLSGLLAS